MKVMVVDDSTPVRQRMLAAFRKTPRVAAVEEASSGEEAVALAEEFDPDVVLLDLMLPGMTGLEVLEVLSKRHPSTRVIVFTNYPYLAFRRRCMELGATHFLGKSTDVEQIIEMALGKEGRTAGGDDS